MPGWAYTGDLSKPLDMARFTLADTDEATARLSDDVVLSAIEQFGYQRGVAVLAQNIITRIQAEVISAGAAGATSYKWSENRVDELKQIKKDGEAGKLAEPGGSTVTQRVPGTVTVGNSPRW